MNTYNIWPPAKGKIISVKKPNIDTLFVGRVYKEIPEKTACTILLMNNNNYVDGELAKINYNKFGNDNKGLLLVYPHYKWNYMQDNLLNTESDKLPYISNVAKGYINFNNMLRGGDVPGTETEQIEQIEQTEQTEQPKPKLFMNKNETQEDLTETIYDNKSNNCSGTDNIKFDYILTELGDPDMNNLFTDDKTIIEITEKPFNPPDTFKSKQLKNKLDFILPVNANELKLVINATIALDNPIKRKEDEIDEGNKIINWLKDQFNTSDNEVVSGLKLFVHNGYVHILRDGLGSASVIPSRRGIISGQDIVRPEQVPNLKYFKWQYGLPIDYDTLKYVLFQNKFQQTLYQDNEQLKEVEKVLSLEYLVAMQPEPLYVMWCVKRLIECWYADVDLQNSIRKIKVLINQYRAKGTENYNRKQHGVLPMIVIYPKYGLINAEIVIKRLMYYFWKQIPVGWKCSKPTYFVQINNLIYYTNGAIDLKLYFKNVLNESSTTLQNKSYNYKNKKEENIFTPKMTLFDIAKRIEDIDIQGQDLPIKK